MKHKKLLMISVALMVGIIVVLTHNYFSVKQNWHKIHAIKFAQGTRIQLTTSDTGNTNAKDRIQYYACESDCSPLAVSNVEIHPTSETTLNIIFSTDGKDKTQISNVPVDWISIDEKTGVLHIK